MRPWLQQSRPQSPGTPRDLRSTIAGTTSPGPDSSSYNSLYGVPTLHPPPRDSGPRQWPRDGMNPTTHSLPRDSTISSPTSKSPKHARSLSHPFPSLFSVGKKVEKRNGNRATDNGTDTWDDEVECQSPRLPSQYQPLHQPQLQPSTPTQKGATKYSEKDLVTGKCATCDSVVRWPHQLDVYRCSVCLMVNDLKAPTLDSLTQADGKAHRADAFRIPRKVLPATLDRTKSLVNQAVTSYLRTYMIDREKAESGSAREMREDHSHAMPIRPKISQKEAPGVGSISLPDRGTLLGNGRKPAAPLSAGWNSSFPVEIHRDVVAPPTRAPPSPPSAPLTSEIHEAEHQSHSPRSRNLFIPLEKYLVSCLTGCDCLNASFGVGNPGPVRATSEASPLAQSPRSPDPSKGIDISMSEIDAKTLLLGDIGENGMWWTGRRHTQKRPAKEINRSSSGADRRTPRIQWSTLHDWYEIVLSCGQNWKNCWVSMQEEEGYVALETLADRSLTEIETALAEARNHVQRTILKATENLLLRPGRPLKNPEDCRFLLILLMNPLLHPLYRPQSTSPNITHTPSAERPTKQLKSALSSRSIISRKQSAPRGGATGQHSGIIKRILGLIANLPADTHQLLVNWFSRFSEAHLREVVELVGGFVSYRLNKQNGRVRSNSSGKMTGGLIPDMSGPGAGTSAHLHAAIGTGSKSVDPKEVLLPYGDDWQVKVAAKVMSLLFLANNNPRSQSNTAEPANQHSASRQGAQRYAQLLPTSAFYNTLVDYADLIADFEAWESRRGKFSFCQYPMFLSIWAKIHIMEYDTRRQMEVKAREAFFNSIISRKAVNQYLVLKVRRDCLVDDSLRSISEIVGTGHEEIKKGLRIEFLGEEGLDAGGLRKEWFLLLVREVFDPEYGLFLYDEESHHCYFNPASFETSDQFFLVGVVLGLAIYNSTILDVVLPPFAFRKLLASAPSYTGPTTTALRPLASYTLEDLAEWRPSLARGLQQLLDHDGNVEETFCRDFVIDVDRYGEKLQVPLCPNGERRPVTNANRHEFVDLYIRHLLDTAVARQYEPFKRGFFTVCGGNALSLFRPEEIELLVCGSDEPLDVASLRAVAVYENWGPPTACQTEETVVAWFWTTFTAADVKAQRSLLGFITGSDRIPAMGATNLVIKVACLGDRADRFPIARTCFNMLGLWRYRSKQALEEKLWRAVGESEGFGLK